MKITKQRLKEIIKEELSNIKEAGMPSSVIKSKQRLDGMSDKDFAAAHGDKTEEQLEAMAWRHGYGKGSKHYVRRAQRGKKESPKKE
jgi:hypothetical protein